jgi:hypothetical protein
LKLYKITLEKQYPDLYDFSKLEEEKGHIIFLELHPNKEAAEKRAFEYEVDYNIEQLSVESQESFYERIDKAATNKLTNKELEELKPDIAEAIDNEGKDPDINIDDDLYYFYTALEVEEISQLKYGIDVYKILVYKE